MERILLKTFSFPCIVKVYLFFEYLKGHTWRMSKKRRKGGFCEKKTKMDTRYEKREGFEKKNGYPQSQNIYCQNTSRKLETLVFFNYKIENVIF